MPLNNVLSVQIRPGCERRYEDLVRRLADKAREGDDPFHWTAHQTMLGETGSIHFVTVADSFASFADRGGVPELIDRCLGDAPAAQWMEEVGDCIAGQRSVVGVDRPDLSYLPDDAGPGSHAVALVTSARVRPARQEAFEELVRKLAEAIPKVDDPARIITFQPVVGELSGWWTVRPMSDLAELDGQRAPQDLLNEAFGPGEGGLIWRGGLDAIEEARRDVVVLREDLSNPG